MKTFYTAICAAFLLLACNNNSNSGTSEYRPQSVGGINELHVVIDNDLWGGPVGETIREYFAAATDGLPQQEPLFSMSQMNPSAHTGFARKGRNFLHLSISDKDTVSIKKNSYAKPQTGAFIQGTTEEGLIQQIKENQKRIISVFKDTEIKENQRRIRMSTKKIDSLKERFGISLKISSVYRTAMASDEFYWLRKDLKSGSTNVIIYEVPLNTISQDSTIGDIIAMRDAVGGRLLPVEDDGRFITEKAYAPYLFTTELDGKFAYETKGTWEVEDQYMAGPFLNYAIKDEKNNRYLVIEGFTYAPSVAKRNLQFELEAVLKSVKFVD